MRLEAVPVRATAVQANEAGIPCQALGISNLTSPHGPSCGRTSPEHIGNLMPLHNSLLSICIIATLKVHTLLLSTERFARNPAAFLRGFHHQMRLVFPASHLPLATPSPCLEAPMAASRGHEELGDHVRSVPRCLLRYRDHRPRARDDHRY